MDGGRQVLRRKADGGKGRGGWTRGKKIGPTKLVVAGPGS